MEPFLTANGKTLEIYFGMTPVEQAPSEALYEDMIVTIIMLKNCGYDSIRKWLSKQHMGPNAQAYPTVSVELVDMMNSGNFEADQIKPAGKKNKTKNKNKNKNKDKDKEEEVVGAIVEPNEPIPDMSSDDSNPSDSDNPSLSDNDDDSVSDDSVESVTDNQDDYSTDDDNKQENICRVFAMICADNETEGRYNPEAEEER